MIDEIIKLTLHSAQCQAESRWATGSSPSCAPKIGKWTGSSTISEQCRSALEQGTETQKYETQIWSACLSGGGLTPPPQWLHVHVSPVCCYCYKLTSCVHTELCSLMVLNPIIKTSRLLSSHYINHSGYMCINWI